MTTHIVLISVEWHNARKVCEFLENQTIHRPLEDFTMIKDVPKEMCRVMTMTDFMDAVNDQELDNLSEYFISYVNLKDNEK